MWILVSDVGALCLAPLGELGVVVLMFDRVEALHFIRWARDLFAPLVVLITASGLQGEQPLVDRIM